ncbi:MAG: Lrp/AsnC ligand binding domain-containing protein [Nanoarchaeota archaeon]|nr:Lrp/AsnC ligand binding domain-containing protein [Nanoarchaeota archaeon]
MVVAYILMVVEPGSESKVAAQLLKKSEVKDAAVVYGEYDIICKVEVDSMEALQNFVISLRKGNKAIRRTTTMIAVR